MSKQLNVQLGVLDGTDVVDFYGYTINEKYVRQILDNVCEVLAEYEMISEVENEQEV